MTFDKDKYSALVASLFERHPSVQNAGFTSGAYKPGLTAMAAFDASLGYPSRKFKAIHIAGTNGKGSVSSLLASGLSASGRKIGLYTSPHLVDFRERIKIIRGGGFEMIPYEEVFDFLSSKDYVDLSFFEITTALAFNWFAKEKVDIAVIETGLGGRLDSTNILPCPLLSIITSIGLDHCALLGDTRAKIAFEKAGIFKRGSKALVSTRDSETAPVFERRAEELGCPLFFADDFPSGNLELDLQGPYQSMNLRTTLAALKILGEIPDTEGLRHSARISGFRGRWEKVLSKPETICDIGHNPAALEINFGRLKELHRPLAIVYGIMADKDIKAIRPLMPSDAKYFLVAPEGPRALRVEKLADAMTGLDYTSCTSVVDGVRRALGYAEGHDNCLVYVGGSNFVVSEALPFLDSLNSDKA